MKKRLIFKIAIFSLPFMLIGLLTSCVYGLRGDTPPMAQQNSIYYRPVSVNRTQLEQSIALKPVQNLVNPGKIYLYGNYILVNERYKGIHIIDNTSPKKPINIAFLSIAGNLDMAIRQNILYVDNAVDLVALDFGEILNKKLKILSRLKNNLPSAPSPDGQINYGSNDNYIVVDWIK